MAYANLTLREISFTLRGTDSELGQIIDSDYFPTKLSTYFANIPNPILGNEPIAGYGAFSLDGMIAIEGNSSCTIDNFLGFFAQKDYTDVRYSNNYINAGDIFSVPVLSRGRICVYAATSILLRPEIKTYLITSVPNTVLSPFVPGAIAQGTLPAGVTYIDITDYCRIKTGNKCAGNGVIIDILLRK